MGKHLCSSAVLMGIVVCLIPMILYKSYPNISAFVRSTSVCLTIKNYNGEQIISNNNYTTKPCDNSHCIEITATNKRGYNALFSVSEEGIVDGYINGDIDIQFSSNATIYEKQITSLMGLYNELHLGYFAQFMHLYHHWMEGFIGGYAITYNWIDQHYTISDHIIEAFVDNEYKLYSHGIFNSDVDMNKDYGLIDASLNKLKFIVSKCSLTTGSRVLDVGGGWGSFLKYAIPQGINVHTVTISNASYIHLQQLIKDNKWQNLANVSLINFWELKSPQYTDLYGTFDAIVCLGTIEHVPYYDDLLDFASVLLKKGGFLHVDGFGTKKGYNSNYFMQKYIYPGDSKPFHASSFFNCWEHSKYRLVSVSVDTDSYYQTMISWARKYEHLIQTGALKVDFRSYRIFQLYLWGMATAFQPIYDYNTAFRVILQKL
eukprot:63983_1